MERHLLDVVRGGASEAVRLELDAHLAECARCREARAAFGLLGALKERPAPRLGSSAERRVLAALVAGAGRGRPRIVTAPRRAGRVALAGAVLAAAGAAALVAAPRRKIENVATTSIAAVTSPAPASTAAEGQRLEAAEPGVIAFAGSGVTYRRGTAISFHPSTRTLKLEKGEIDVDVSERQPARFRVQTVHYFVEVLGTRFVVTPESVRPLDGRVRVLDLAGRELADVPAGASWSAPAPAEPPVPAIAPPPAPARSTAAAPSRSAPAIDVAALVTRARSVLAAGDAAHARALLDRALSAAPAPAERAAIELLSADALLVARRPDEAIAAYRAVLRRHPRAPEGETAAFAVGQLLLERGADAEAGAALNDYVAQYPHGRFVREARERLAQIRAE
jgi:hypothetical protein